MKQSSPPSAEYWGLVSKILTPSVNIPKKRPESVAGTLLSQNKYCYPQKSSAGWDTADSNSSKTVANSSETLPDLEFFFRPLRVFFRQSHAPSSLPDRHQRPHSLAQRLHDLHHVQVHLFTSFLILTRAPFHPIPIYVNSQISRKKISGKRQTNNFRSVVAFFVEILGLWTVSWATSIILRQKKRSAAHFPAGPLQVRTAN